MCQANRDAGYSVCLGCWITCLKGIRCAMYIEKLDSVFQGDAGLIFDRDAGTMVDKNAASIVHKDSSLRVHQGCWIQRCRGLLVAVFVTDAGVRVWERLGVGKGF